MKREPTAMGGSASALDVIAEFLGWLRRLTVSEGLMLLGTLSLVGWLVVLAFSFVPSVGVAVTGSDISDPLRHQIVGWVLLFAGVGLIAIGGVLGARHRSKSTVPGAFSGGFEIGRENFAQVKLGDPDQYALLRSIRFPHGTRGREVWLAVEVDGRYYPQPVTISDDGTIANGYLQFGTELDKGKRFDLELFSMAQDTAERLREYFQRAVKEWDWDGMTAEEWPPEAQALFRASFIRE